VRFGIAVFPGTWSDRDCAWVVQHVFHQEARFLWHADRDLQGSDCVILPGGFSYGDHLRCGAVARFAPLMEAVADFAQRGGLVLGICNGFQILQEARLLPGALLRNDSLQYRCRWVHLRTDNAATPFTRAARAGQVLRIPISHGEGNFYADPPTLDALERAGQVVFRYCDPDGRVTPDSNPNGSQRNIAGIVNARGNVLGMMPHPERCAEVVLGGTDGRLLFESVMQSALEVLAG
jgi:phosphoribosylformylglycinamidine synthase